MLAAKTRSKSKHLRNLVRDSQRNLVAKLTLGNIAKLTSNAVLTTSINTKKRVTPHKNQGKHLKTERTKTHLTSTTNGLYLRWQVCAAKVRR